MIGSVPAEEPVGEEPDNVAPEDDQDGTVSLSEILRW